MKLNNWLQGLIKPKQNLLVEKETTLNNTIELLNTTIKQLTATIESQQNVIVELSTSKVETKKEVETTFIENPINVELQQKVSDLELKIQLTESEKQDLQNRLHAINDVEDIEKLRFYYKELLTFAFRNIGEVPFDPNEARFYWENLVK